MPKYRKLRLSGIFLPAEALKPGMGFRVKKGGKPRAQGPKKDQDQCPNGNARQNWVRNTGPKGRQNRNGPTLGGEPKGPETPIRNLKFGGKTFKPCPVNNGPKYHPIPKGNPSPGYPKFGPNVVSKAEFFWPPSRKPWDQVED